ncbi:Hypothetical predicted protein [Paramuricea clavata]|uniref:Uncharacterized protein n=1 Tax=Paramuricea clavata TaxID=317549 RepID=A0A7D9DFW1_PARCT|nr:Hypothetical predicted protein [Paramuricea clavata]
MEWDQEAMKAEVMAYGNGILVNWSELGRRYGIKNTSGNLAQNRQIAFEWLKSKGVDVERFKKRPAGNDAGNIRKRLKWGAGGEITVPCPETNKSVQEKLKQKYKKLVLNDEGSVNRSEFYVEGCKCSLTEIRKRKLSELERFMRLNAEKDVASMSEEERFKRLTMLNETKDGECKPEMKGQLQEMERRQHLMRMLQYKTESQETLNSENTKLKEQVKELEKTFFDKIDEDSENQIK